MLRLVKIGDRGHSPLADIHGILAPGGEGTAHGRGQQVRRGAGNEFQGVLVLAVVEIGPDVVSGQELAGLFNLVKVRCRGAALSVDKGKGILEKIFSANFLPKALPFLFSSLANSTMRLSAIGIY